MNFSLLGCVIKVLEVNKNHAGKEAQSPPYCEHDCVGYVTVSAAVANWAALLRVTHKFSVRRSKVNHALQTFRTRVV